ALRAGGSTARIGARRAGLFVGDFLRDFVACFGFQHGRNARCVRFALDRPRRCGGRLVTELLLAFLHGVLAAFDRHAIFVHLLAFHLGLACRLRALIAAAMLLAAAAAATSLVAAT